MRKIIVCTIFIGILATACSASNVSRLPAEERFTKLQTEETVDQGGIKLIRATKEIKKGDAGEITIQGKARTVYKITCTYNVANRTLTAVQSKTARGDGMVTWKWNVDKRTLAGTYPVTIIGGGTTFLSSFRVID